MKKVLVLSSGGLDSTTCVGIAIDRYGKENVSTVSIFYGQRHSKELECAKKVAEYYNVNHYEMDLSKIFQFSNCSLLKNSTEDVPEESYEQQIKENNNARVSTYVPFRNGLMLATATSIADSLYPNEEVIIMYGAHKDDATGNAYADCSQEFADAINKAINIGTYNKIQLEAPLININKAEVVKKGIDLKVPYELTWSCYKGEDKQCGKCGTCIDRKKAFELNNAKDPVEYKEVQNEN